MPELPSGTVTLLFTDIEGSTRLLRELGRERYIEALDTHRRLLREAFADNGGVEVEMQGAKHLASGGWTLRELDFAESACRRLNGRVDR